MKKNNKPSTHQVIKDFTNLIKATQNTTPSLAASQRINRQLLQKLAQNKLHIEKKLTRESSRRVHTNCSTTQQNVTINESKDKSQSKPYLQIKEDVEKKSMKFSQLLEDKSKSPKIDIVVKKPKIHSLFTEVNSKFGIVKSKSNYSSCIFKTEPAQVNNNIQLLEQKILFSNNSSHQNDSFDDNHQLKFQAPVGLLNNPQSSFVTAMKALQQKIKNLELELNQHKDQFCQNQNFISELIKQKENFIKENRQFSEDLKEKDIIISELQKQILEFQAYTDQLEKSINQQKGQYEMYQSQFEKDLKDQKKNQKNSSRQYKDQIKLLEEKDQQIKQLEEENCTMKSLIEKIQTEKSALEKVLKQENEKNIELQKKLDQDTFSQSQICFFFLMHIKEQFERN